MTSPSLILPLDAAILVAAPPADPHISAVEKSLLPLTPVAGDQGWTIQERMAHYKVSGVSVAVLDNSRIVWAKGYGFANAEAKRTVNARTRFLAGSVSKPVAAMAAMKLTEQGKLAMDSDINTQLKSWHLPGNEFTAKTPITLRMLMSHSGGLTVHGFDGYELRQPLPSVPDILNGKAPANSPQVRVDLAPNTQFRYSGGGITIEQLLMSDVTGEVFPALLDRLVLRPLGMVDSSYAQPEVDDGSLPTGYRRDGRPVQGRYHLYPEMAAAGLWTSPSDLLKVGMEILAALQGKGKVLSAPSAQAMLTPRFAISPDGETSIGLGWFLERHGQDVYFGHSGSDEGFQCVLVVNATTGQGAAVMTNSDHGLDIAMELVRGIAQEYDWPGYVMPVHTVALEPCRAACLVGRYQLNGDSVLDVREKGDQLFLHENGDVPLRPLTQDLFIRCDTGLRYRFEVDRLLVMDHGKETPASRMATAGMVPSEFLKEGKVEEAIAGYHALQATSLKDPGLNEARLNQMGCTYLGQTKMAEALALFVLNTELYPDSCNTWDSLGEASLTAGDKERAKASYRKALESLAWDKTTDSGLKDRVRKGATAALAQLEQQP